MVCGRGAPEALLPEDMARGSWENFKIRKNLGCEQDCFDTRPIKHASSRGAIRTPIRWRIFKFLQAINPRSRTVLAAAAGASACR